MERDLAVRRMPVGPGSSRSKQPQGGEGVPPCVLVATRRREPLRRRDDDPEERLRDVGLGPADYGQ
eukprot:7056609-Lingulodinium_polyedra.AAC.1